MSYTRRFRKRIEVPYSGSVSVRYPASEHGGTTTEYYSGTAYEDVEVEIEVETEPFDNSVDGCNSEVNMLTGSVVAMNSAQVLSIRKNSERVSKSIIDGFFQSVKSDISTQKMMLEQTVESRMMLLRDQMKTLLEKKQQMEIDYQRTSQRYHKIFTDLDKELSVRIHRLDQPVFNIVREIDDQSDRMLHTEMISTVTNHNEESGVAQAHLNLAKLKDDARETLSRIHGFLAQKAVMDRTLEKTTFKGEGEETFLVPVCYLSTESENHIVNRKCVVPKKYLSNNKHMEDILAEKLSKEVFKEKSESDKNHIVSYVQNEMNEHITGQDSHARRVKETINKLLNKNII